MLVNFPKLRISKIPRCATNVYIVEIQKRTWYGRKYWIHIESYLSRENTPRYYFTEYEAMNGAIKNFKWMLQSMCKQIK